MALSSRLALAISRAGIFDLRINLPEDFDIESLSGEDIGHWDEVREGGHAVILHYRKQALGNRSVNLVLGRMGRGIEAQVRVPRIGVPDAVKHTGTLAVSGERGSARRCNDQYRRCFGSCIPAGRYRLAEVPADVGLVKLEPVLGCSGG